MTSAEYRFNNQTLAMGYQRNLLWTCGLIDYLKESDKYHWTIVGEFTRGSLRGEPLGVG